MNQQEHERGDEQEQRDGVNESTSEQAPHGPQLI
jgi:hypothetical protein